MAKGPAANFVRDTHRNAINGLLVQKSKTKAGLTIDRFYALFEDGKRKYFGNSLNTKEAIRKFRKWEAERDGHKVAIIKPVQDVENFEEEDQRLDLITVINPDGTIYDKRLVAADAFWATVGEQLRSNPKLAAQKTGIEELAYLDQLKPPPPSATLQAIGKLFQDDKKASMTPKEWANSKTWWDEFLTITAAKRVRDLDRDCFRNYRNTVLERMIAQKRSNSWARSRFGKIKTIINHALREMDLGKEEQAVLAFRSLLKQPPKPAPNPIDITPDEFGKILKRASAWDKALFLIALNCAYYPKDCARLKWSMIDFSRGTIRADRLKATGRAKKPVPRVAVLWKRTLDALKKLSREQQHVFALPPREVRKGKKPKTRDSVHPGTLSRHFNIACEAAKLDRHLTFANLRDSALTAAAESTDPVVPIQQYHVLGGHVAEGVDDSYISRHPRFVETASRAIENRYFGRKR